MNAARRYRVVVFDWDGTLIDSTATIVNAIRSSAADLGLPIPTREQAAHVIGMGLLEAIAMAVPSIRRGQLPAFVDRYRVHFLKGDPQLEAFDGVPSLLDEIAETGAWLAVATGKSRAGLDRALDRLGWNLRFVTTRCADEGEPKPHPWMLHDICEELGLSTGEVLMVGDTTHDLGMARAAGSDAIAVGYGAHPREELGREPSLAIVDSVTELREALLGRIG